MQEYEVFIEGKPRRIALTRTGEKSFSIDLGEKTFNVILDSDRQDLEKSFSIKMGANEYRVKVSKIIHGKPFQVKVENISFRAEIKFPERKTSFTYVPLAPLVTGKMSAQRVVAEGAIIAPMTGKVVSIKVNKGDHVKAGTVLCVVEAMKMENEIASPKTGVVREVNVCQGSSVSEGEVLFVIG